MDESRKIDLHMHTTSSDGTDTPAEILIKVRAAGLTHFSVTDHDAVKGCTAIRDLLCKGDPAFICGVEFSCKDEEGKYHILGYGYDPTSAPVCDLVDMCHSLRINRVKGRLDFLRTEFGFAPTEAEREALFALNNPGKPHIADLMIKHGYATSIEEAFRLYLDKLKGDKKGHIRPEEAIRAILQSGGIPVLAHPAFGSGSECILGEELKKRVERLTEYGIRGLEAYYSGFSEEIRREVLFLADRFGLYVTAGSDYHGTNKKVPLGDTHLDEAADYPEGLKRFLQAVQGR